MPVFRFTDPYGKTHEIEGPDGATPDQAFQILQQHLGVSESKPKALIPGTIADGSRNLGQADPATLLDKVKGIGEAGLTLGTGMVAGAVAPIAGGIKKLTGNSPDWEQATSEFNQALTYSPTTDKGQEYLQDYVDPLVQRVLMPLGGLHMAPMARPGEMLNQLRARKPQAAELSREATAPLPEQIKAPVGPSMAPDGLPMRVEGDYFNKNATQMELPLASSVEQIAEQRRLRDTPNQVDMFAENSDGARTPYPAQERLQQIQEAQANQARIIQELEARRADAQTILEARQKAMELEVQRKTTLEQNARERARQENAPTGYADWMANKAVEESRQTHSFLKDRVQSEIDATPYGDVPAQFGSTLEHGRIDENGIPIRADLSMEAQNLQNPLQRNLWGDELPGRTGDNGLALTQALDKMPFGPEREAAVKQLTGGTSLRSQRGGIDPDLLTLGLGKAAQKMHKSVVKPLMTKMESFSKRSYNPGLANDYLAKLPGMAAQADKLITRPEPTASVLEAAKAQADGPGVFENLQSGLGMVAEKSDSVVVKNSARWLEWGNRKGNYLVKEVVRPLEHIMTRMTKSELTNLMSTMKDEMFGRAQYTPEQLQQMGFTPKMMDTYRSLRDAFDTAYNEQNKYNLANGKPEITKQEAYLSSMFHGDYHIPVYSKEGSLVWYVQVPTRSQAKAAITFLKEKYAGHAEIDVSGMKTDWRSIQRNNFKGLGNEFQVPKDMMSSWKSLVDAMGDDPRALEVKQAMEQWIDNVGGKFKRQDLHQVDKKANIRGFSGDQPWKTADAQAHDLAKAQVQYLENSFKWAPMQEVIDNVKQFISDPDIIANQPNNVAITKAYLLHHMGLTKSLTKQMEVALGGLMGRSSGAVRDGTALFKSAVYVATLTGSPGYAIATPMQAVAGSLAYFTMEAKRGNLKALNPVEFITRSFAAATTKSSYGFRKSALEWADNNGVVSSRLFDENKALGAHPILSRLEKASDWTISRPDQWTRKQVFLPFAEALYKSGKFTKEQAFQRAGEITGNIMVSMKREDRPLVVSKLGALGDAAFVYKAPVVNMYNHLSIFGREAAKGNIKPALTYLAALTIMGGVLNMPGVNETVKAMELLKAGVANFFPEHYEDIKDIDPRASLLSMRPDTDTLGQVLNFGLGSVMTGADMSTRFGNELLDVEHPLKSLIGPMAQEPMEWASALKALARPNANTAAEAARVWAPGPMARGLMEVNMPQYKSKVQPDNGNTLYKNPNRLEDPSAYVERNPTETAYKALGMNALSEAQRRQKDFINNRESQRLEKARDANLKLMIDGLDRTDGKDIAKHAQAYFRLGGDMNEFSNTLQRTAEKMGMTPMQYSMAHATKLKKIMDVQRRMEMNKQ
jgi:hypothetical protein